MQKYVFLQKRQWLCSWNLREGFKWGRISHLRHKPQTWDEKTTLVGYSSHACGMIVPRLWFMNVEPSRGVFVATFAPVGLPEEMNCDHFNCQLSNCPIVRLDGFSCFAFYYSFSFVSSPPKCRKKKHFFNI